MGREQKKVSQRVEVMLLPSHRCPPSAKLGAQAGKEVERLQQKLEKPVHASSGSTLLALHWFKTGHVCFCFKAETAKLSKDCFQPSLEKV